MKNVVVRLFVVLMVGTLLLGVLPVSAAAVHTSVLIANVVVDGYACDAEGWEASAYIDITIDVPETGAFADMRYQFVIEGAVIYDMSSALGVIGPGPTTQTELGWGVGDSGTEVYPANTPIHINYYDANSGFGAGFAVDCTTGAVLDVYQFGPAQPVEEPVVEEPVPGCDALISIPSTAVGATITSDTLAYWEPGQATDTLLAAGTNVRAISQADGWYEILFVCDFLYVPVGTLGPNYESPWNGAPLP